MTSAKRGGTYDVMSDPRFAGWFSESNICKSANFEFGLE